MYALRIYLMMCVDYIMIRVGGSASLWCIRYTNIYKGAMGAKMLLLVSHFFFK